MGNYEAEVLPMETKKGILCLFIPIAFLIAVAAHYRFDPWGFYWKQSPEETRLRCQVVRTAEQYLGYNEADNSHCILIDRYNAHEPLAVDYVVQPNDSWCATFVSAVSIELGLTQIIPTECGCERQIKLFQSLDAWEEDDSSIPLPGDIIYYDWDETKWADATGWSDHVGIVVGIKWPFIKVIEGNKDDAVSYRILLINDIHIRGFGKPDYASVIANTP